MPKYKDYTGQKFGRLECLSFARREYNVTYWKFKCDCGKIIETKMQSVVSGITKSCGCLEPRRLGRRRSSTNDYAGQKFGRLECLYEAIRVNKVTYWKFQCDCGKIVNKNIKNVLSGGTKSCGCLREERYQKELKDLKDYTGEKFGRLKCISRIEEKSIRGKNYWKCECDCGRQVDVRIASLLDGSKSSCGCIKNATRQDMLDYTGHKFGHLECIYKSKQVSTNGGIYWLCKCDCGRQLDIKISSLLKGYIKSCGCLKRSCNLNSQTAPSTPSL